MEDGGREETEGGPEGEGPGSGENMAWWQWIKRVDRLFVIIKSGTMSS